MYRIPSRIWMGLILCLMCFEQVETHTAEAETDPTVVDLREVWGTKKGSRYSQEAVELGCELMSHNIGAQTALGAMRTFMARFALFSPSRPTVAGSVLIAHTPPPCSAARLYPASLEGRDYRLPHLHMLRRWRRYLEPVHPPFSCIVACRLQLSLTSSIHYTFVCR